MIELIVVVAIMSILVAILVSNFPKINTQLSLSGVSNAFEQNIRLAQQMALSNLTYKDAAGLAHVVDGYGIYVDLSSLGAQKYVLYADKSPGNKHYDSSDYIVSTVDFSKTAPSIAMQSLGNLSANNSSINFSTAKIETMISNLSGNNTAIKVFFAAANDPLHTKTILVHTSGLIENQ